MDRQIITDTSRVSPGSVPEQRLLAKLMADGYAHIRTGSCDSPVDLTEVRPVLEKAFGAAAVEAEGCGGGTSLLLEDGGGVLWVEYSPRWHEWHWAVASNLASNTERWAAAMTGMLPPFEAVSDDGRLYTNFWAKHPMAGGYSYLRPIEVQGWSEIAGNYPESVRAELGKLVTMRDPGAGGKLVLLHGPPGTGKTRSIMALLAAWREWCEPHVITDPDSFFNHLDYMNDVILGGGFDDGRWRVLIVEDGDEFMDVDAKSRTGQALSRLLNLGDGIVGQGLNVLTIITTNVEMGSLNPAVARTGRCMTNLHYPAFDQAEAESWLASRQLEGVEVPEDGMTLADLYGAKRRSDHLADVLGRFD
ncbi:MAG TPA: AAA family ATPase [Acidimicrobiales bacterium]|nr:AAA family ATPase [Acidimicrobiales bacterium]